MRVLLLNGPNLNLLGTRRPDVYGSTTLSDLETMFRSWGAEHGVEVETFQSNHEGALIDRIHDARGAVDGIVFNPGAYTHTSYALHDAIESVEIPTVEVHISNVEERETWRRFSAVRPACVYTIYGRGIDGYRWGLLHLLARAAWPFTTLRYGESPDQVADLRLPSAPRPARLAVLVHGGFWRHMWTRDTTEHIAVDLARRGMASLNVEYRRVGSGGGGPSSIDDVAAAVRSALASEGVDGTGWVIVGHSAGGQLAVMAAAALSEAGMPPRLAVSMGGVNDLVAAIDDDLGSGAALAYLAGADPTPLSPSHHGPFGFPLLAAHGSADDRVPHSQAERLVRSARANGGQAELATIEDGDHFGFLDPTSPAWTTVAEALLAAGSG
jgi:3-dehydroquinate dehydratase II